VLHETAREEVALAGHWAAVAANVSTTRGSASPQTIRRRTAVEVRVVVRILLATDVVKSWSLLTSFISDIIVLCTAASLFVTTSVRPNRSIGLGMQAWRGTTAVSCPASDTIVKGPRDVGTKAGAVF
jgi:hypothetical protein